MEPTIISFDKLYIVGISFFGDPFDIAPGWDTGNQIGRLWQRFFEMKNHYTINEDNTLFSDAHVEVWIEHQHTHTTGEHEIFIGIPFISIQDIPPQFQIKLLPASKYAQFTLTGNAITEDWEHTISSQWISQSQYCISNPYTMQLYDYRFKGMEKLEESEIDIYIPIKAQ